MPASNSHRGRTVSAGFALGVFLGALVLAVSASAQQPGAKPAAAPAGPPKISPASDPATFLAIPGYDESLKKGRTAILSILRAGKVNPDQEVFFDTYYSRYSMARWTVPANYTQIPAFRKDLRNDLQLAKVGDAHTRLSDMIFRAMTTIASGNYHPVVRVNAMLMVGELNSEDPAKMTDDPVPYHQAVGAMVKAVDDPQQLDGVKAAALVGLLRHARLGIRDDMREAVTRSMLNLAKSPGAPGRSDDGHAWMRSQALEIVGALKSVGTANVVANTVAQIAGDSTAPLTVRRAAARAAGELGYQIAVSFNASALASALAQFTAAAADAARTEAERDKTAACRRLKSSVLAAASGARKLAESLKDPQYQKSVAAVRDEIDKLARSCDRDQDDALLAQAGMSAGVLRKLGGTP